MIARGLLAAAITVAMLAGDVVIVTAAVRCGGDATMAQAACTCRPDHCPSPQGAGIKSRCCDVKAPSSQPTSSQARLGTTADPAPVVDTAAGEPELLPVSPERPLTADRDYRVQHPPRYHLFCSYLI